MRGGEIERAWVFGKIDHSKRCWFVFRCLVYSVIRGIRVRPGSLSRLFGIWQLFSAFDFGRFAFGLRAGCVDFRAILWCRPVKTKNFD